MRERPTRWGRSPTGSRRRPAQEFADHIARWHPARVLAECEAKRRIVEEHGVIDPCDAHDPMTGRAEPCPTLLDLASVYADHPDFDPAWR